MLILCFVRAIAAYDAALSLVIYMLLRRERYDILFAFASCHAAAITPCYYER